MWRKKIDTAFSWIGVEVANLFKVLKHEDRIKTLKSVISLVFMTNV